MKFFNKINYLAIVLIIVSATLFPAACTADSEPPITLTRQPAEAVNAQVIANDDYLDQLLKMIRTAEESLHLAQLYFNDDGAVRWIINELEEAADRGVNITGIVNRDDPQDFMSMQGVQQLQEAGANINWASREGYGKLHAKLVVADVERVLVGSTNWSAMSIFNNNELNLYVEHPGIGYSYVNWIERLFLNPTTDPDITPLATAKFKPVFDRQLPQKIKQMLEKAEEKIWLGLYVYRTYFANDEDDQSTVGKVSQLLAEAHRRGLDLRIMLDESDYQEFINQINSETINWFKEQGVEVRQTPKETISHWKLLIVDDAALVSSMNWGFSGFKSHAEAGLWTADSNLVTELKYYFSNLWDP